MFDLDPPPFIKTREEYLAYEARMNMARVKGHAMVFKMANAITTTIAEMIFSRPAVEATGDGIRWCGDKLSNLIPIKWKEYWKHKEEQTKEFNLKNYNIPYKETEEYYDNLRVIRNELLTTAVASAAKFTGRGLKKITQQVYVSQKASTKLANKKFEAYAQKSTRSGGHFECYQFKDGFVEVYYAYDVHKKSVLAYVNFLQTNGVDFKELGKKGSLVPLKALKKILGHCKEINAQKLKIVADIHNPFLFEHLKHNHALARGPITYPQYYTKYGMQKSRQMQTPGIVDHFDYPLKKPEGPLNPWKDAIPLAHLSMAIGESSKEETTFQFRFKPTPSDFSIWETEFKTPEDFNKRSADFSFVPSTGSETPPAKQTSNRLQRPVTVINPVEDAVKARLENPQRDTDFINKPGIDGKIQDFSEGLKALAEGAEALKEAVETPAEHSMQPKVAEQEKAERWKKFIEAGSKIIGEVIDFINGNEENRQVVHDLKEYGRDQKKLFQSYGEQLTRQQIGEFVPEIRSAFHSPEAYFTKLNQVIKDYENDVKTFQRYVEESRAVQSKSAKILDDVKDLDEKGQKLYRKLIESQIKSKSIYNIGGKCAKVVGVVCSATGCVVVGAAVYGAGSAAEGYGNSTNNEKVKHLREARMKLGRTNQETASKVHASASAAIAREQRGLQGQAEIRSMDRYHATGISFKKPEKEIGDLKEGVGQIEKNINNVNKLSAENNAQTKEVEGQLNALRASANKGSRKSRLRKQAQLKSLEAKLTDLSTNASILTDQNKRNEKELQEQKEALGKVEFTEALRKATADKLKHYNIDPNESETDRVNREKHEQLLKECLNLAQVHDSIWQDYNTCVRDLYQNSGGLVQLLSKYLPEGHKHRIGAFVGLSYQGWQMFDCVSKMLEVSIKVAKEMKFSDHIALWRNGKLSGEGKADFIKVICDMIVIFLRFTSISVEGHTQLKNLVGQPEQTPHEKILEKLERLQNGGEETFKLLNDVYNEILSFDDRLKAGTTSQKDKAYSDFMVRMGQLLLKMDQKLSIAEPSDWIPTQRTEKISTMIGSFQKQLKSIYQGGDRIDHAFQKDSVELEIQDVGKLHYAPQYLTGFLANYTHLRNKRAFEGEYPNLALLNNYTKQFIECFNHLKNQPIGVSHDFKNLLRSEAIKWRLLAICTSIQKEQHKIRVLTDLGLVEIVRKMIASRDQNLIMFRHHLLQAKQVQHEHEINSNTIALTAYDDNKMRELTLGRHFVGADKFYLRRMIQKGEFLKDHLGSPMAVGVYENYYLGTTILQRIGKAFLIASAMFGIYEIAQEVQEREYKPKRLIPAAASVAAAGTILAVQPEVHGVHNSTLINTANKFQTLLDRVMALSLRELCSLPIAEVGFDDHRIVAQRDCPLFLDLRNRFITANPGTGVRNHIGNIRLDSGLQFTNQTTPKVSVDLRRDVLSKEDINAIPPAGLLHANYEDYDMAVKLLIQDYYEFIDHKVKNVPLDPESPFYKERDQCVAVAPLNNPHLVSLIISHDRIDGLRGTLRHIFDALELLGIGTPLYYYDFSVEECTMRLHFKFQMKLTKQVLDFGSIVADRVDPITLRCFQKDLTTLLNNKELSEFLIQFYYCGFGFKLGMPGAETHQLKNKFMMVAPKEVVFPGAYWIGKMYPEGQFNYRYNLYTEEVGTELCKCVKRFKKESTYLFEPDNTTAKLFTLLPKITIGKDFGRICAEQQTQAHVVAGIKKEFHDDFLVALAMIKLASGVDEQIIANLIENYFDIEINRVDGKLTPEFLFDSDTEEAPISDDLIQTFVDQIKQEPSKELKAMELYSQEICAIESFLTGTESKPKVKSVNKPRTQIIGLDNIGNSCYLNAVVQVLMKTTLPEQMGSSVHPVAKDLINVQKALFSKKAEAITSALFNLRQEVFESADTHSDFTLDEINEMQDARVLLETLLGVARYSVGMTETRVAGQLSRSQTTRQVILNIQMEKDKNLNQLLDSYFSEKVNDPENPWRPEKEEITQYSIRFKLTERPSYLFLSLKRFGFGDTGPVKNNDFVALPENGMLDLQRFTVDGKPAQYRLLGCIDHLGQSTDTGHYTAYVRQGEQWHYADDARVRTATFEDVSKANHYCYIFELKE